VQLLVVGHFAVDEPVPDPGAVERQRAREALDQIALLTVEGQRRPQVRVCDAGPADEAGCGAELVVRAFDDGREAEAAASPRSVQLEDRTPRVRSTRIASEAGARLGEQRVDAAEYEARVRRGDTVVRRAFDAIGVRDAERGACAEVAADAQDVEQRVVA
jgi:hypothetical protein